MNRLAYDHTGHIIHNKRHVAFPDSLDLSRFCTFRHCATYKLKSIIEHRGGASQGHYVAAKRLANPPNDDLKGGDWIFCNDSITTPITGQEVLSANAYMLFYEKQALGAENEEEE